MADAPFSRPDPGSDRVRRAAGLQLLLEPHLLQRPGLRLRTGVAGPLWGLVLAMLLLFQACDKPAAWLQLPYLLWVSFAAYLNFGVWAIN